MSHQGANEARLKDTLGKINKKFVVLSGKGGVGKSTVAVNLAYALALSNKNVGLLDCDLHGPSVPSLTGFVNHVGIAEDETFIPVSTMNDRVKIMSTQFYLKNRDDSVVWRGPLKHSVISQFIGHTKWGNLDYLIIDSPPGTGDEPLSVVQTAQPDGAIIVTTPQIVATHDVRKSIDFCEKLSLSIIGVIENMSGFICPKCGERTEIFGSGGGEKLSAEYGIKFLGKIPLNQTFMQSGDTGKPSVLDKASPVNSILFSVADIL